MMGMETIRATWWVAADLFHDLPHMLVRRLSEWTAAQHHPIDMGPEHPVLCSAHRKTTPWPCDDWAEAEARRTKAEAAMRYPETRFTLPWNR